MTFELFNNKEEKILELKTRRKIYEIVKKFAGSHFREIFVDGISAEVNGTSCPERGG